MLQDRGLVPADELTRRLGVDARAVRPYVAALRGMDTPVESVGERHGGYRLARGVRLPPLMLADDEAVAVALALASGKHEQVAAPGPDRPGAGQAQPRPARTAAPPRHHAHRGHLRDGRHVAALAPHPAAATSQAAAVCPTGYLCLQPSASSARPVLVKEGDSRTFSGGLKVTQVSNQTRVAYCVTSTPYNYALSSRQSATRAHTVLSVRPAGVCPA
ncbi:helix-turn-helix transcriptional regulator [Nonomuraea sp. NPDC049400]|uniref:helix-turn-helix transcriptional regulator n=1 Tax=Nonomuraea sp. NPDC049400 TaxID=3364352 RepID=UPI00379E296C